MRYVVAIGVLLLVVLALVTIKYKQISQLISFGKTMQKQGPPPETVSSAVAKTDTWQETLDSVGTIAASKGVTVSNDAAGLVSAIHFESGDIVRQGQVLVELDNNVERAQLASVEARKDLAQLNAGRTRALVATNAIARAQQDNDDAVVKTSRSDVDLLGAQIARKVVRAPFAGKLGIRQINLGQYLNPGTPIVTLDSTDALVVDFTLPQQRLPRLSLGMPVQVLVEGEGDGTPRGLGAITAIDPSIDQVTRSIKLRASLSKADEKLLPGMFVKVSVVLPTERSVVIVPTPAILHASYGDSIFLVEDKKDDAGVPIQASDGSPAKVGRQQFVKVGETRGDFVSVTAGIKAGDAIVSAGAFKLRNGSSIVINNAVVPTAELSPHPENR
jgi:membrane fusion protein (multidrug efflux system)